MAAKNRSRGRCIGHRRTKKYRGQHAVVANADAGLALLNRLSNSKAPLNYYTALAEIEQMRGALQNMIDGRGALADATVLVTELNVANELCAMDFNGSLQHMPVVDQAHKALRESGERSQRIKGRWALDGIGIQAISDLIELREAQLLHEDNRVGIEKAAYDSALARAAAGHVLKIETVDEVAP